MTHQDRTKAYIRKRILFFMMLLELRKEWIRDTGSDYIRESVVSFDAYIDQHSRMLLLRISLRMERMRKLYRVMEIAGW
jgi:hypothetical protein